MPTYTRHAVVGYFADEDGARAAIDDLVSKGFSRDQIHISAIEETERTDYAEENVSRNGGGKLNGQPKSETHQGGLAGWFRSLFGSNAYEDDARQYTTRTGGSIVGVDTTDETRRQAIDILNSHGATDIDGEDYLRPGAKPFQENEDELRSESADLSRRETGYDATRIPQQAWGKGNRDATVESRGEGRTIPVIREELEVGKRAIVNGGVRVYSRTVEEPVEQEIQLHQERVVVDRQPADRAASPADQNSFHDETIEVMEMTEEPVIQKRARVVEEVRVGKESAERTETVRDTLRHTEVQTEPITAKVAERGTSEYEGKPDYRADFERDFEGRYGSSGEDYGTYAPAHEFGSEMAVDARYKGKNWSDVEPTMRADFGRRYPRGSWDRMKDAVKYGWDRLTGK